MTNPDRLWDTCADSLRTQLGQSTWLAWFDGVRQLSGGDEPASRTGTGEVNRQVVLSVPASVVKERLEARYMPMITEELGKACGGQVKVRLTVATEPGLSDESVLSVEPPPPGAAARTEATRSTSPAAASTATALNPAYTFDAFVTGPSNRFAEAAAQAVAEMPGSAYNPLFIYGGSGLGKTHLLHAIGNYVHQHFPHRRVLYVPTETFLNQFIHSMRTKAQTDFKQRYRVCDVLLFDDVDLLENKEALQEEFFHTFNALYQSSTQIVLSADRPPKQFLTVDDRLRSRLLSGVTTTVEPPDLETRLAILGKKAEGIDRSVPPDVLEFIATNIRHNIRELEGALIRVTAFANLNEESLTLDLAEKLLADVVAGNQPRQLSPAMILAATGELFGFSVEELCGASRRRSLVTARHVGMYVCRQLTDHSYPMIAREFGGRDHTTVIHAINKISTLMAERRQIYEQVIELMRRLQAGG